VLVVPTAIVASPGVVAPTAIVVSPGVERPSARDPGRPARFAVEGGGAAPPYDNVSSVPRRVVLTK
jgi:hypothetical protein